MAVSYKPNGGFLATTSLKPSFVVSGYDASSQIKFDCQNDIDKCWEKHELPNDNDASLLLIK